MYMLLNDVTYLVYVNIVFNNVFNIKVLGRGREREREKKKKKKKEKDK